MGRVPPTVPRGAGRHRTRCTRRRPPPSGRPPGPPVRSSATRSPGRRAAFPSSGRSSTRGLVRPWARGLVDHEGGAGRRRTASDRRRVVRRIVAPAVPRDRDTGHGRLPPRRGRPWIRSDPTGRVRCPPWTRTGDPLRRVGVSRWRPTPVVRPRRRTTGPSRRAPRPRTGRDWAEAVGSHPVSTGSGGRGRAGRHRQPR